ncbi:dTMP kinase [Haloferula luteola]|uniref:Thymidylate kinase n=1 Tax=Haloferula luteola TaxID=595692 RepID=A0A840V2N9_9BACT|nr:dTMP kinase [Haloferula luteola]MBB5351316.1 dTMP kinase [Haloferula luteola]
MLIAFEGIDGAGKTSQARLLADWLESEGSLVVISHEPTNGPWGTKLRESASSGRSAPEEELDLFLKDRKQHVEELIQPSLNKGVTVILDRYYFSNMAYQGARGLNPSRIREVNEAFAPVPDFLFILDLEVDLALQRIGSRGDIANEFEKRDALQDCRDIFNTLENEAFAHIIDASKSLDEVHSMIREILSGGTRPTT